MKKYDVVVVGGGPVGGHVSKKISEKNCSVAILEKNNEIGKNLNCAGLVTKRVFEITKSSTRTIQNKISGANIHSPSDIILKIGGEHIHALVIDRINFDKEIIKQAEKKQVDVFLENKLENIKQNKDTLIIKTSTEEVECKILVGADGPFSKTRKLFKFLEPKELLKGAGAEVSNVSLDPNFVEIFVGQKIAPGFFAWIIPINKNGTEARVGLCVDQTTLHPPTFYFKKFLINKQVQSFLKDAKITRRIGGVIPLGFLKKTFTDNVLIVGDAAAQVKPTSGGGLYPGLLSADHCANVAVESLEKNDFSANFLKKYHKLFNKDIGKELNRGMTFRTVFRKLSDDNFDKYISKFKNQKIVDIINKYGDIDYPSKLANPLIKKNPSLLKLGAAILKNKKDLF
jgi:digeranylgeranylglycerophospholipid reductase